MLSPQTFPEVITKVIIISSHQSLEHSGFRKEKKKKEILKEAYK